MNLIFFFKIFICFFHKRFNLKSSRADCKFGSWFLRKKREKCKPRLVAKCGRRSCRFWGFFLFFRLTPQKKKKEKKKLRRWHPPEPPPQRNPLLLPFFFLLFVRQVELVGAGSLAQSLKLAQTAGSIHLPPLLPDNSHVIGWAESVWIQSDRSIEG